MNAAAESTPRSRRDVLSALLHRTLTSMPAASPTEQCDALASVAMTFAELEGADDAPVTLACANHVWLSPALAPTLGTLLEALVDFFSRQSHTPEIARSRAESVLEVVRLHLEVSA